MRITEILAQKPYRLNEVRVTVWSGATINVLHNPSRAAFENLAKAYDVLRGLMTYDGRELWLWPAYAAVHPNIQQELGLDRVECIFYNRGQWRGPNLHDEETGLYKPAIQRLTPAKIKPYGPDDDELLKSIFGDIDDLPSA